MATPDDNDFRAILAVAREAGDRAAELQHETFDRWEKEPGNPVSAVDLHLDDLIKSRLRGIRPGYGWLSEETADDPARLACDKVWVVDPLDGTRAYLKGRDGYAVSIALVADGEPVMACLYAPVRQMLFAARRGEGVTLNGAPITVSPTCDLADCRMVASADMFAPEYWPEPWPPMRLDMVNSIALRIGLVAAGLADAVISLRPNHEWDLAAASLILAEAGGRITDHVGRTQRFNQPRPLMDTLVAATPDLHEPLRQRIDAGVQRFVAQGLMKLSQPL